MIIHPALLWLLLAAPIPILLHLLTLHRLKTVELSTFRFLFDSYVQQRRRMRFLEALLAMLRTLFLLLLILLVGRPVVQHWGNLFGATSGGSAINATAAARPRGDIFFAVLARMSANLVGSYSPCVDTKPAR